MQRKVFKNLNREKAVEIRSMLHGMLDNPGFKLLLTYFAEEARSARSQAMPIVSDDFATLNKHNRRLYRAEAFEEVVEWVDDAKAQCDSILEGEGK